MKNELLCHGFKRTPDLEQYVQQKLENPIAEHIKDGRYHLTSTCLITRPWKGFRSPRFLFEVVLKTPHLTKPIVIKKRWKIFTKL